MYLGYLPVETYKPTNMLYLRTHFPIKPCPHHSRKKAKSQITLDKYDFHF